MKIKPNKQTVYIPVKVEDELPEIENTDIKDNVFAITNNNYKFIAETIRVNGKLQNEHDYPSYANEWLKECQLIIFTPEEYNQHIQEIIKQTLKTAAKNAVLRVTKNDLIDEGSCYTTYDDGVISVTTDKNSITEVLPKILEKWKL